MPIRSHGRGIRFLDLHSSFSRIAIRSLDLQNLIFRDAVCNSRERITNPWERIPNPREWIAHIITIYFCFIWNSQVPSRFSYIHAGMTVAIVAEKIDWLRSVISLYMSPLFTTKFSHSLSLLQQKGNKMIKWETKIFNLHNHWYIYTQHPKCLLTF